MGRFLVDRNSGGGIFYPAKDRGTVRTPYKAHLGPCDAQQTWLVIDGNTSPDCVLDLHSERIA
jgi:hypothetical protein